MHGDAAGGDTQDKLKGWGVCCLETGEWRRQTWPKFILNNKKVRGIKYGRKLTLLETHHCRLLIYGQDKGKSREE